MSIFRNFALLIFIFSFSCSKIEKKNEVAHDLDSISSVKEKIHKKIIPLNNDSEKLVKNWVEYQKFNDLIQQYQHITLDDALLSATELAKLSQQLKDSIRIEKLNIPSVRIRLNVVNNEALRLQDMSTIPSINSNSVINENIKLIDAFSALNLKINSLIKKERLNNEISDINSEIEKSKKDSIIQSVVSKQKTENTTKLLRKLPALKDTIR